MTADIHHSALLTLLTFPFGPVSRLQPGPRHESANTLHTWLQATGQAYLVWESTHSWSTGDRLRERDSPPSLRPPVMLLGPWTPRLLPLTPSMMLPNALGLASEARPRLLRGLLPALPPAVPAALGLPPELPLGLPPSARGLHPTTSDCDNSVRGCSKHIE